MPARSDRACENSDYSGWGRGAELADLARNIWVERARFVHFERRGASGESPGVASSISAHVHGRPGRALAGFVIGETAGENQPGVFVTVCGRSFFFIADQKSGVATIPCSDRVQGLRLWGN